MSSFTYPGKERLAPRLRRFAGGLLLAALLVAVVWAVKPLVDENAFEALLSLTPLSKDSFENLIASPVAGLLVFVGMSWLMSKLAAIEVLESHLFPWFDDETLHPVSEKTGLLHWVDFEDGPAREISSRLRAWLSEGVHDSAWPIGWILRGRPALLEKAFSYSLLLGPNGIGKSQLAREVAREKSGGRSPVGVGPRASVLARTPDALARWARHAFPQVSRLPDDPWHVGEVITRRGDWSERLSAWRPSAPTVLILDDAPGAIVREAIDVLDKNSGQFWYSVKLIVVDQFTPLKLVLEPIGRSLCDHLNREILVLSLPDLRWSGEQTRRAFSGGVWIRDSATGRMRFDPAHNVPAFWDTVSLERLSRALDGNPLMLAEAAVWLATRNAAGRAYRTVGELLALPDPEKFEQETFDGRISPDYRSEIAHRLLEERVDEVFKSHLAWAEEMLLDPAAVVEALCCASLAGGGPLSAFEVFNRTQGPRLEKWIARDLGKTAWLPPVGSWPISEVFIERALEDYRTLNFKTLVQRALAVNPVGLAQQFTRKGRLARRLFEEVARLEGDAGAALPFALNLFEFAAARAIWADRDAAPRALAALEKLPAADLAQAQAELETLGTGHGRVPDVLVAALLLTALGARRFAEADDWDWSAWETFHPLWMRWLRRFGSNLEFAPPALRDPMMAAGGKLHGAFFIAAGKLNDPERAFEVLADAVERANTSMLLEAIPMQDEPPVVSWPAVFQRLFVLKGISWNDRAIAADGEGARRRAEAMAAAARDRLPADADPRQRGHVEAFVLRRRIRVEALAGGTLGDLEAIGADIAALAQDFPDDRRIASLRLFSISFILRSLREKKGDADLAWAMAEEAEAICKPFLSDKGCVEALIWCWGYTLGTLRAEDDEAFGVVMARLRNYARAFPQSDLVQVALAGALDRRIETLATVGERETPEAPLLALASQAETAAREVPEFADMQWARALAWQRLAERWATDDKRGLRIGAIAQDIDELAQPFPDHLGLQSQRLAAWESFARYESRHGVFPGEAERIARRIAWAAEPFRGEESVSVQVAWAWEAAVYGWHRDLRAWMSCENALRRFEAWLAENRPNSNALAAGKQIFAWGSLLIVHRKRRDFVAVARLEPEALDRAEAACATYPDDQDIAENAGYIFAEAAHNRHERNTGRAAIEEMAARMQALAARFPHSQNLRVNRAFVDRLLRGPAANAPPAWGALRVDAPIVSSWTVQFGAFHQSRKP